MRTKLGPLINHPHRSILDHRRPRRRHGGTVTLPLQRIVGTGVVVGPRIKGLPMFSPCIAVLAKVQTRTRMGCSVGQSHSPIRRTLLEEGGAAGVPGDRLIPGGDGFCGRVETYQLVVGSALTPDPARNPHHGVDVCSSSTFVQLIMLGAKRVCNLQRPSPPSQALCARSCNLLSSRISREHPRT